MKEGGNDEQIIFICNYDGISHDGKSSESLGRAQKS